MSFTSVPLFFWFVLVVMLFQSAMMLGMYFEIVQLHDEIQSKK